MKKLILSLVFTFAIATSAKSQVLISLLLGDKLNSDKLEFGLNGGFNFSNMSGVDNASVHRSFHLGFYFDIYMSEKIWFNPSVLVKMSQGTHINDTSPYPIGDANLDAIYADGTISRQLNYFQVPLLFKYKLTPKFHVLLGPQVGLRHKSYDKYEASVLSSKDSEFKKEIGDNYTRLDFGMTGGLGYRIVPGGMTVGAKYYQGMVDVLKDNPGAKQLNSSIYLYFTVPVGKGKAAKKKEDTNG